MCQYKQGPLTLRAICPIQERRWRRHPILRGGGASEKAGKEAQAETAHLRAATRPVGTGEKCLPLIMDPKGF